MHLHHLAQLSFCSVLFASACVTVKVGDAPPEKATSVKFQAPSLPFAESESAEADRLWTNSQSAVSISFVSRCNDGTDPRLSDIQGQLISAVEEPTIELEKKYPFNSREALDTTISGRLDGIPVKLRLISFKKNNCHYTLSYVGKPRAFAKDAQVFENFSKSFEAP